MEKIIQLSLIEVATILDGADGVEDEVLTFLDIQSEEVVCLQTFLIGMVEAERTPGYADPDELELIKAYLEDPDRFVQISPLGSSQAYGWRQSFAETLPEVQSKEIHALLDGAGAFSRFNDYLADDSSLAKAWELYELKAMERYLQELVPEGVKIELV